MGNLGQPVALSALDGKANQGRLGAAPLRQGAIDG